MGSWEYLFILHFFIYEKMIDPLFKKYYKIILKNIKILGGYLEYLSGKAYNRKL